MPSFEPVLQAFQAYCEADPTYSAQLAVHVDGERVVDLVAGTALTTDSLVPVYSSSKGAIGVVVALLVERGQLDLDATVATYWPEFARKGKAAVTVRQLLSHQAGLLGVDGGFTWEELCEHTTLAERLADQRPLWQPGQAFQYHGLTIGTLADELVRRIDGRSLASVLHDDVTTPRAIDLWMGTPESQDHRIVEALAPDAEDLRASLVARVEDGGGQRDHFSPLSGPKGPVGDLLRQVNDRALQRVGPPAVGVLTNGRGLAALYACLHHETNGQPRLLDDDTIAQMAQVQVTGMEIGSGAHARFGVVFQAPHPKRWPFGGVGAFGHDGAGGSLAFCDPAYGIAFGYVVQRLPMPGGMDARAVELARLVRSCLR